MRKKLKICISKTQEIDIIRLTSSLSIIPEEINVNIPAGRYTFHKHIYCQCHKYVTLQSYHKSFNIHTNFISPVQHLKAKTLCLTFRKLLLRKQFCQWNKVEKSAFIEIISFNSGKPEETTNLINIIRTISSQMEVAFHVWVENIFWSFRTRRLWIHIDTYESVYTLRRLWCAIYHFNIHIDQFLVGGQYMVVYIKWIFCSVS